VKNGTESDVDCGGSCATKCGAARACGGNSDCASGACSNGQCTAPSHCTSGGRNGNETDVDCGGSCLPCGAGDTCAAPQDCQSGSCECAGLLCLSRECG
jgi:hypothetical protein